VVTEDPFVGMATGTAVALATVAPGGGGIRRGGTPLPAERALWQIGSITKTFTALVLARAVVRGDLALDTRVASLLPDTTRWPDGGADLTLGELATHTAGLPRLPVGMWGKVVRRDRDPYADIDPVSLEASLAGTRIRRRGRVRYSNLGFGLLGHALSRAAGTPYDDLVRQQVCGPLGLDDTVAHLSAEQRRRVVPGRTRRGRPRPVAWGFDAMAGCGALWSSIEDLQALAAAVVDPPAGQLGDAIRLTLRPEAKGRGHDQGLGWVLFTRGPAAGFVFHNGGTSGYRSSLMADPATGRAAVALAASDRGVDPLTFRALVGDARPAPWRARRPAGPDGRDGGPPGS
jgi:CubicO group peptidase (beta-lactamase class C family)